MSILSMQRTKFKVSRNKSIVKSNFTNTILMPLISQSVSIQNTFNYFDSASLRR